jgi:hypothetical protein
MLKAKELIHMMLPRILVPGMLRNLKATQSPPLQPRLFLLSLCASSHYS